VSERISESGLGEAVEQLRTALNGPRTRELVDAFAWLRDVDWEAINQTLKPTIATMPIPFPRTSAGTIESDEPPLPPGRAKEPIGF
jgi:hypothetical protein